MGALYLKDLAVKTRRGIEGRIRRPGRQVTHLTATKLSAASVPMVSWIVREEATVVRRIFGTMQPASARW